VFSLPGEKDAHFMGKHYVCKGYKKFKKYNKLINNTWLTTTWGVITSIKTEHRKYRTAKRYDWAQTSNAWPGVLKLHSTFAVIHGQHVQPTESARHIFVLTMSLITDGMFVTFCRLEQKDDKTWEYGVHLMQKWTGHKWVLLVERWMNMSKKLASSTQFKSA